MVTQPRDAASLRTLVQAHTALVEELPLIHTSRCELLPKISRSHALEPQDCGVFEEKLLYFFYGRPAYRSSKGRQPGESQELCPVCFVFKPGALSDHIARVYPCDSGALTTDLYHPTLRSRDLVDLELDPTIDAVRRYISLFFNNNGNYYLGRVCCPLQMEMDDAATRLHALLSSTEPARYDDRRSAIEVQVRTTVDLRHSLLHVVLPRIFLDDPRIRQAIFHEWRCDPIPYPTFEGDSPAAYYSVIRDKLLETFHRSTRI